MRVTQGRFPARQQRFLSVQQPECLSERYAWNSGDANLSAPRAATFLATGVPSWALPARLTA